MKLSEITFIEIGKAKNPPDKGGLYALYKNYYWILFDYKIGLFLGYAPQCNLNKSIVDKIASTYKKKFPDTNISIEKLDYVYIPYKER